MACNTSHGARPTHSLERINQMRESLNTTLRNAQRAIEASRKLQESEVAQRIAAMRRLEMANEAVRASASLMR